LSTVAGIGRRGLGLLLLRLRQATLEVLDPVFLVVEAVLHLGILGFGRFLLLRVDAEKEQDQ
jgi:hypothetical protein